MSGQFFVFDPDEVSVLAVGVPIDGGWGDGAFIEVIQEADDFVTVVGSDGDVTRSKTNDRRATVNLTLTQGALANSLLSVVSNLDRTSPNGAGVGPLLIKDNQGTTLFEAEHSWVMKPPDVTFDRTATNRVWKIGCANLRRLDGSN